MAEARLKEAQLSVLQWIADGCSDGVMEGYSNRISASALKTRGLVQVTGHGPTWRAELSKQGRAYLDNPPAEGKSRARDVQSRPKRRVPA